MSSRPAPWLITGGAAGQVTPADRELRWRMLADDRQPTELDRPVSTFPATPASRAARRIDRAGAALSSAFATRQRRPAD